MTKAIRQAVVDCLTRLAEEVGEISPEKADLIRCHANAIYMGAGFGALDELPRMRSAGRKNTEAQLRAYAELARELGIHIRDELNAPALRLLWQAQDDAPNPFALFDQLAAAIENVRRACNSAAFD